jgi:glycosyltransferase involved in cell wall biosynthesis
MQASILLLTYNQELYVKEALLSLLEQDYNPLEIIVSDDCSTDGTWLLINEITQNYRGPKCIVLNQNTSNLGIVRNYFKAFELSKGEVIFTAAGDDVSLPNRCSACIQMWKQTNQEVDLVAADGYDMLENGVVVGVKVTDALKLWTLEKWAVSRPYIFGASHMMTRRLVGLRSLSPLLPFEDQCLVARALMMGGAIRCPVALVKHRRGGVSQVKNRWSHEKKKKRLILSAQQGLIECEEISLDAHLLGISISSLLKTEKRTNEFALRALQTRKYFELIGLVIEYRDVKFKKKFKFLSYVLFKPLYQFLFFVKSMKG